MTNNLYSAEQIARWFTEQNGGEIASIKLQKLCYYAQAWSLALHDKPMIAGDFEAWVHGPVHRGLWNSFRSIAYRDITMSDFKETDGVEFTDEENEFLELVWNTYGEFSGYQLEAMTHREKPWTEQRVGVEPFEACTRRINPETMKSFYRELYSQDGVQ